MKRCAQRIGPLLRPCLLAACLLAAAPVAAQRVPSFDDPLIEFNKTSFAANRALDRVAFRPLSHVYRELVPKSVRKGIVNAFANLEAPSEALNHLLQLDVNGAFTMTARFAINSTLGIAGFVDVAAEAGLRREPADFGLTMARYGFGEGAYLVIPLLGPSTVRDAVGAAVDFWVNPLRSSGLITLEHLEWAAYYAVSAIDFRLENEPLAEQIYYEDEFGYARLRSFFLQNRRHLANGGAFYDAALPDLDLESEDDLLDEENGNADQ